MDSISYFQSAIEECLSDFSIYDDRVLLQEFIALLLVCL